MLRLFSRKGMLSAKLGRFGIGKASAVDLHPLTPQSHPPTILFHSHRGDDDDASWQFAKIARMMMISYSPTITREVLTVLTLMPHMDVFPDTSLGIDL